MGFDSLWSELPYTWLGVAGLVILWCNALLVILAGTKSVGRLLDYRRRFRAGGQATIVEGAPFGHHLIEQTGRRASDDAARRAILFHDSAHHGHLAGGLIELAGGERVEIPPPKDDQAEVWVDDAQRNGSVEELQTTDFDAAYRLACKARGYRREVKCSLQAGESIWFAELDNPNRALIASFDPRGWCTRRVLAGTLALVLMVAVLAGLTYLTLRPPVFGKISTLGGVLSLAYFLLVQPAGVTLRDALAPPSRSLLRGSWVQEGSEGLGGAVAPSTD